jgi:hypothetical protein
MEELKALIHQAQRGNQESFAAIVRQFQEIVRFLEIPLTTVQKRLHDARKRLKERMLIMVENDLQENRPSKDDRFVEKVLEFIAPNKKEHGEKIYDMIEMHTPSVDPYLRQWRDGRIAHSRLDWQALDWWIEVDELPTEPADFELHEFDPVHRDDLTELYNRTNENITGTTVRPTYLRNKEPNRYQGIVLDR